MEWKVFTSFEAAPCSSLRFSCIGMIDKCHPILRRTWYIGPSKFRGVRMGSGVSWCIGRARHSHTSSPRSISLPCHVCFGCFLYVLCLGCWWNRAGCQAAPGWVEKTGGWILVYRCGSSRFLLSGGRHTHGSNRLVEPANRIWGCCALTAAASSPVTVGVDLVV